MPGLTPSRPGPKAVWTAGLALHFVAIFHRSSLAVAGLVAIDRFHISAAQLANFTVLQLLVHALLQVPVGLVVDRLGSRTVLLAGVVLMSAGQCGFAFAHSYGPALAARVVVGAGDALTFVSVLRLVARWVPPRRVPVLSQLLGVLGQAGALVAALPMTWALGSLGWTTAYLIAASAGPVLVVVLLLLVHDAPGRTHLRGAPVSLGSARRAVRSAWVHPGTRLAFWIHFTTPFSANAFSLLWGYPFLIESEECSPATAGLLLMIVVGSVMVAGPLLGWVVGVLVYDRSTIAAAVVVSVASAWSAVLLWPGPAPFAVLVVLAVTLGIGSPASMIGFEVGRTFNPPDRLASATGLINSAGFLASLLQIVAIGVILDLCTPGPAAPHPVSAFQWAMSSQYLFWGLGLAMIWTYRRRTRAVFTRDDARAWSAARG